LRLFFKPEDQAALSLLLFAKAQSAKILVGLEENINSPWGDQAVCGAMHVEIM
jgi:hypothetical protein